MVRRIRKKTLQIQQLHTRLVEGGVDDTTLRLFAEDLAKEMIADVRFRGSASLEMLLRMVQVQERFYRKHYRRVCGRFALPPTSTLK
jgi:hypothetical protein